MRVTIWRTFVFVLALLAGGLAFAPASLIAPKRPGEFSYDRARGTIWRGSLEGLTIGPFRAQTLSWRLSFADLFQGKAVLAYEASGADMNGRGQVLANWGGDRRLVVETMRLNGLSLGSLGRIPGESVIEGLDVFFDAGRCAAARGTVRSDVLTRTEGVAAWRGPRLSGDAACEGEVARILLNGGDTGANVNVRLELSGDGAGRWRADVTTDDPEALNALGALGFDSGASGTMSKSETVRWLPF